LCRKQLRLLNRLARLYGIETFYRQVSGKICHAAPASLLAILNTLGAPVDNIKDVKDAARQKIQSFWQQCCEPVTVAWDGEPAYIYLRLSQNMQETTLDLRLELENGRALSWACNAFRLPTLYSNTVEGLNYELKLLNLPSLPLGYHRLKISFPGRFHQILIISAPRTAYHLSRQKKEKYWGIFIPLYALRSQNSWGAGDLADLDNLMEWVHELGGDFIGTLPLLASFLDKPFVPSPYAPVSRLFWNEFYLDAGNIEEFNGGLMPPNLQEEIAVLQSLPLVDYRRVMTIKRKILEQCAAKFFNSSSNHQKLQHWTTINPAVLDYARFRATVELHHSCWYEWPQRMRDGFLKEGDYNPGAARYHLYVQWMMHRQLDQITKKARQRGQKIYLDLPLGVHRAGYDVWRERSSFVPDVDSGAPPDTFFTEGQNWGFPPLHPEGIRQQGYRYFISCLRNHLQYAGMLRLDHVMNLHHLYWIPPGMTAREGVYVRYKAEEFYAILALESQRHRAFIIGEDLGTVPGYVHTSMKRYNIYRMYILPFEFTGKINKSLKPVPSETLAGLNTHDMPPFASFWLEKQKKWEGAVLPLFLYRQGWLDVPTNKTCPVLKGCLAHLAASKSQFLLINLEDLWLETSAHNLPGTTQEYPNWRRKTRYTLEEFKTKPGILNLLKQVNHLRKTTGSRYYRLKKSEVQRHEL